MKNKFFKFPIALLLLSICSLVICAVISYLLRDGFHMALPSWFRQVRSGLGILVVVSTALLIADGLYAAFFRKGDGDQEISPDLPDFFRRKRFAYIDGGTPAVQHGDSITWLRIAASVPSKKKGLIDDSLEEWAVIRRDEKDADLSVKEITEIRNNGVECKYTMQFGEQLQWLLSHDIVRCALDKEAWTSLKEKAAGGDPESMSLIGSMTAHAASGNRFTAKAVELWEAAAESGVGDAMRELATYYWNLANSREGYDRRDSLLAKAVDWNERGGCHVFAIDRHVQSLNSEVQGDSGNRKPDC